MLVSLNHELLAQEPVVFEEWASTKGVQEYFYKNVTKTDASQNVYVAGATLNANGDYDLLITKFDRRGNLLWTDTIAGSAGGHDFATDLDFDQSDNVVVSGSIASGAGQGNNMLAVKYSDDGTELWRFSHDHSNNNEGAASLVIDQANNIYLTGATQQSSGYTDIITLKIDSTSALQWEELYDGNNLHDAGVRIEITGSRVIVTGGSQLNSLSWKVMAMSYLQVDGTLTGFTTSSGTDPGVEEVTDLVIDDNDNIYIAGSTINVSTGYDMLLIKLDEDLNIEWTKEWDGDGMTDKGSGVRVAPNGDVYLCGTTETATGDDIALLKFSSDGSSVWEEQYDSDEGGDDAATALEWQDGGYLYLTGNTYNVSNLDYLTMKYDSTGSLIWDITYNSPYNKDDKATNLAIDDEGDIIVSGQCEKNDSVMTYYTAKYIEATIPYNLDDTLATRIGSYELNRGQVTNELGNSTTKVKFSSILSGNKHFALDDGLSFVFVKNVLSNDSVTLDTLDRIDLLYSKTLSKTRVRSFELNKFYRNFVSDHTNFYNGTKILERMPNFDYLYFDSLWDDISAVVHSDAGSVRNNFILGGSADLADIEIKVKGFDSLEVQIAGEVRINGFLDSLLVGAPKAFSINQAGNLVELTDSIYWTIIGNSIRISSSGPTPDVVSYTISKSASASPPPNDYYQGNLVWSTYFGGEGRELTRDMDVSLAGEISVLYQTRSEIYQTWPEFESQPSNTNLYGSVSNSSYDRAEIGHLGVNHFPEWITVISAGLHIQPVNIIHGENNDIFLGGMALALPSLVNADQTVNPYFGVYSSFVGSLDYNDGSLTWLTWLGGTDGTSSVRAIAPYQDLVYVAGFTNSSDFPTVALAGGYNQPTNFPTGLGGFETTGYITSYDLESGEKMWSTYFGGDDTDRIDEMQIVEDKLYVAGMTRSTPSPTVYSSPSGWEDDGFQVVNNSEYYFLNTSNVTNSVPFLTEFSLNSHEMTWCVRGFGRNFDIKIPEPAWPGGEPTTNMVISFPLNPSSFTDFDLNNPGDYFDDESTENAQVVAFFKDFNLVWSTIVPAMSGGIGTKGNSVKISGNNSFYFAGWTPAVTPVSSSDYCSPSPNNEFPLCNDGGTWFFDETYNTDWAVEGGDGYIFAMHIYGGMQWSTFFGGNGFTDLNYEHERVTALGLDENLNLYATGHTFGGDFPIVNLPGAYNQDIFSGELDGFMSKFAVDQVVTSIGNEELHEAKKILEIYPNPVFQSNVVTLRLKAERKINSLVLFDSRGAEINADVVFTGKKALLTTDGLKPGVYLVKVLDEMENSYVEKIINY